MHELSIKPLYDSTVYVNPRVFAILSYNILFKHKSRGMLLRRPAAGTL